MVIFAHLFSSSVAMTNPLGLKTSASMTVKFTPLEVAMELNALYQRNAPTLDLKA
jgi:hypothetical protein